MKFGGVTVRFPKMDWISPPPHIWETKKPAPFRVKVDKIFHWSGFDLGVWNIGCQALLAFLLTQALLMSFTIFSNSSRLGARVWYTCVSLTMEWNSLCCVLRSDYFRENSRGCVNLDQNRVFFVIHVFLAGVNDLSPLLPFPTCGH